MKKITAALLHFWETLFHGLRAGIHPVFLVFHHDVKLVFKNISTIIIAAGLAFLPSLYAWINIYACWDPYANTGNLPVAIVSKDQGAVYNGKVMNAGDEILAELKKNKSIGWDFVDEWQANYGLNQGKYYAMIEVPDNFSARLLTLTSTTPQKPVITYRTNQKLNSIATKITDAAKTKLVENIKSNFVKTVTSEVINTVKTEMKTTSLDASKIKELKTTLSQANETITTLKKYISTASTDSANFQIYLNKSSALLPKVNAQMSNLQNILSADRELAQNTETTIRSVSTNLNTDMQQVNLINQKNQQMLALLQQANANAISKDTLALMQQTTSICNAADALLQSDRTTLNALSQSYNLPALSLAADSLQYVDKLILNERDTLKQQMAILSVDASKEKTAKALTVLSKLSDSIADQLTALSARLATDTQPVLNSLISNFSLQLGNAGKIAQAENTLLPQMNALAAFNTASGQITSSQAAQLNKTLTTVQESLNTLLTKVGTITEEDLDYVTDLITNHPGEIADFISSPVTVKEVDIYNSSTFGVGVAPFYTVLAIWIGALLSCALLTVNFEPKQIGGWKLNLVQKHFGKMLMFLCLSLLQSMIIVLGDVFLLGVHPADFQLLLGLTALTSVTFTILIFTLVSLFGNVGKAIAVVMMVFQIAGAGGIYPIQTNPQIFGMLAPLWPFSYAIDYFREAIAGPVWSSVQHNVRAMFFFIAGFLLLAIFKKPFHLFTEKMEKIYKKAQI